MHKQTGFLRHLVLRTPANTDERMVNLVTNGRDDERMAQFAAFLRADFPETTTFVNTINTGVAQTAFGEEIVTVFGSGRRPRPDRGLHVRDRAERVLPDQHAAGREALRRRH